LKDLLNSLRSGNKHHPKTQGQADFSQNHLLQLGV
jgi:hypothetical protein